METKRSNIPPHGILRTCTYLHRRKSPGRSSFMSIFSDRSRNLRHLSIAKSAPLGAGGLEVRRSGVSRHQA